MARHLLDQKEERTKVRLSEAEIWFFVQGCRRGKKWMVAITLCFSPLWEESGDYLRSCSLNKSVFPTSLDRYLPYFDTAYMARIGLANGIKIK